MTYAYARKNYINTQTHKNTFKQDRRYKLWNFKQCHSVIIVISKKNLYNDLTTRDLLCVFVLYSGKLKECSRSLVGCLVGEQQATDDISSSMAYTCCRTIYAVCQLNRYPGHPGHPV